MSPILFLKQQPKITLACAIVWTIIIFVGCSMPGSNLPKVHLFNQFDKVVHFSFFFFFFIFWYSYRQYALLFILLAIAYGFGIEFYQKFCVTGRNFDVWDGLADSAGALFAYFIWRIFRPVSKSQ